MLQRYEYRGGERLSPRPDRGREPIPSTSVGELILFGSAICLPMAAIVAMIVLAA